MTQQDMAYRVFLALMVWREARGEAIEGKAAVAHVALTRSLRPGWWGRDLMGVLFKKWQFSSLTDPNDKQLTTWPEADDPSWKDSLSVACDVLDEKLPNPAPWADSYFDDSISAPDWATPDKFIRKIGRILFYRVK